MEYTDPKSGIIIRVNREAHESIKSWSESLALVENLKKETKVKPSKSFIKNILNKR